MRCMWLMIGMLVAVVGSARGAEYYVPDDFATIQEAINACGDLDTVIVRPTGAETPHVETEINFEDFTGMEITVRSMDPDDPEVVANTVIRGQGFGHVFSFVNNEGPGVVLKGLTITGGSSFLGGGIWCAGGSPTIQQCVITGNSSGSEGAGVYCIDAFSSPILDRCVLSSNTASGVGGAVFAYEGSPLLLNCLIVGNEAQHGGAVYYEDAIEPRIEGCTIVDNVATQGASAVHCAGQTHLRVQNTIFWGNVCQSAANPELVIDAAIGTAMIDYSVVQGAPGSVTAAEILGTGILTDDPLFVEPGDYHLQDGSPCIDAGDPDFVAYAGEADLDGEARVQGSAIDIGADETSAAVAEVIEADVHFAPAQIYRNLPNRWILCMIRIDHPDYRACDIDTNSILLNETLQPVRVYKLRHAVIARFEHQRVLKGFAAEDGELTLTVSGLFKDGAAWAGSGQVEVKTFRWHWRHWWKKACRRW